jgi:hypothetical protein
MSVIARLYSQSRFVKYGTNIGAVLGIIDGSVGYLEDHLNYYNGVRRYDSWSKKYVLFQPTLLVIPASILLNSGMGFGFGYCCKRLYGVLKKVK